MSRGSQSTTITHGQDRIACSASLTSSWGIQRYHCTICSAPSSHFATALLSLASVLRGTTLLGSMASPSPSLSILRRLRSFILVASHAGNEFPNDIELQKKHAHLDWITREMVGTKHFTGILPQIWGVQQPLSAEVAAMLQAPSESAQVCAEV